MDYNRTYIRLNGGDTMNRELVMEKIVYYLNILPDMQLRMVLGFIRGIIKGSRQ